MVTTPSHREVLTSIMVSTHLLALERLRYVDHAHQPVPCHERVCRFCSTEVKSPEHALTGLSAQGLPTPVDRPGGRPTMLPRANVIFGMIQPCSGFCRILWHRTAPREIADRWDWRHTYVST